MDKINIGKLVNDNYSQDDVIGYVADSLARIVALLADTKTSEQMINVGIATAQLSNISAIVKTLDEKVNGKKPKTIL